MGGQIERSALGDDGVPSEVAADRLVQLLEAGLVGGQEDEGVAVEAGCAAA